jgi:hypothetical protein
MEKGLEKFSDILTPVNSLSEDHLVVKILKKRRIPNERWVDIFYTDDFFEILRRVCMDSYKVMSDQLMFPEGINLPAEKRIVVLTRKITGEPHCFIGRSLKGPMQEQKYRSISLDADTPLIYNAERVNPKQTVYICEGAFDSMCLNNAVALSTIAGPEKNVNGGTYMRPLRSYSESPFFKEFPFDDMVFTFDNQLGFKPINDSYTELVKWGHKVFIWPDEWSAYKDLNDLTFDFTKDEIHDIIEKNTFSGDEAMKMIRSYDASIR